MTKIATPSSLNSPANARQAQEIGRALGTLPKPPPSTGGGGVPIEPIAGGFGAAAAIDAARRILPFFDSPSETITPADTNNFPMNFPGTRWRVDIKASGQARFGNFNTVRSSTLSTGVPRLSGNFLRGQLDSIDVDLNHVTSGEREIKLYVTYTLEDGRQFTSTNTTSTGDTRPSTQSDLNGTWSVTETKISFEDTDNDPQVWDGEVPPISSSSPRSPDFTAPDLIATGAGAGNPDDDDDDFADPLPDINQPPMPDIDSTPGGPLARQNQGSPTGEQSTSGGAGVGDGADPDELERGFDDLDDVIGLDIEFEGDFASPEDTVDLDFDNLEDDVTVDGRRDQETTREEDTDERKERDITDEAEVSPSSSSETESDARETPRAGLPFPGAGSDEGEGEGEGEETPDERNEQPDDATDPDPDTGEREATRDDDLDEPDAIIDDDVDEGKDNDLEETDDPDDADQENIDEDDPTSEDGNDRDPDEGTTKKPPEDVPENPPEDTTKEPPTGGDDDGNDTDEGTGQKQRDNPDETDPLVPPPGRQGDDETKRPPEDDEPDQVTLPPPGTELDLDPPDECEGTCKQRVDEAMAPLETKIDRVIENQENQIIPILTGMPAPLNADQTKEAAAEAVCQEYQPGGCARNSEERVKNDIENARKNLNDFLKDKFEAITTSFNALNSFLNQEILQRLIKVNDKLGDQLEGGLSGFLQKAWKATHADKIINALNLAASLHNAAMLSRNLGETMGDTASGLLSFLGIKDSEDNPIDVNEAVGNTIDGIMTGILGESVWDGTKTSWRNGNRLLSSAVGVYQAVQGTTQAAIEGIETVGSWVAAIGNKGQEQGLFEQDSLPWMNEDPNFKNPLSRLTAKVEGLNEATESVYQVVNSGIEVQQNYQQTVEAVTLLKEETEQAEQEKEGEEQTEIAANENPTINDDDLLRGED